MFIKKQYIPYLFVLFLFVSESSMAGFIVAPVRNKTSSFCLVSQTEWAMAAFVKPGSNTGTNILYRVYAFHVATYKNGKCTNAYIGKVTFTDMTGYKIKTTIQSYDGSPTSKTTQFNSRGVFLGNLRLNASVTQTPGTKMQSIRVQLNQCLKIFEGIKC